MYKQHIQGIVASVASATPTDVFSGGAGLYPWPASSLATTIVSSSANDVLAGSGAITVKVDGLDANFMEIFEIITLNGTSPVTLVNSYLRINRLQVMSAGSDGTNDGIISVKQSSTVIAAIAATAGRSQMAIYTASGNRASSAIKKIYLAATNEVVGGVTFQLLTRKNNPGGTAGVWQIRHVSTVYGTACPADAIDFASPIYLDAGEDVRIFATSNANSTAVAAGFDIWEGSSSEFAMIGPV
jgi:hypothetical protein